MKLTSTCSASVVQCKGSFVLIAKGFVTSNPDKKDISRKLWYFMPLVCSGQMLSCPQVPHASRAEQKPLQGLDNNQCVPGPSPSLLFLSLALQLLLRGCDGN